MKRSLASLAVASAILSAASAQAALQLIQFSPLPLSPGTPEFEWTNGQQFKHAAGNIGNGDGNLALNNQTAGGLSIDTPFQIPAVPGSTIDANGTHFYDVTFTTTGLTGVGNATTFINLGQTIQPLASGTFQMTATDGVTILLTGNLTSNSLTIPTNSTSSAAQSATVTYTGGLIFNAAVAAGFANPVGSMSISMVSIGGAVVVTPVIGAPIEGVFPLQSQASTISPFQADATGVFDLIPEPASMGLFALGSLALGRRRRA